MNHARGQRQPLFHRGRFLTGTFNEEFGVKDVTWLDPTGEEMTTQQWVDGNARSMQVLLDGRAQPTGIRQKGSDRTLLMMLNAHHEAITFVFPSSFRGSVWKLLVETAQIDRMVDPHLEFGTEYELPARSLALWEIRSLS